MYRVRCVDKIDTNGLSALGEHFRLAENDEKADVLLVRSTMLREDTLDSELLAIARAGSGVNNIPLKWCTEHGIAVFNTPGANANAVKELTVCGLLMCSRRVLEGAEWVKNFSGCKDGLAEEIERSKKRFVGPEISGKTLGIVGLGKIGRSVAQAALALGMNVIACDPNVSSGEISILSLEDVLGASDYITLHLPLNDTTRGMINAKALSKVRYGARLLNFARGELADSEAILEALSCNRLAAYVTDFPDSRLIGASGVLALPHLGASTPESEQRCAYMATGELREYIENGNVCNSVNTAEINIPRTESTARLCILHAYSEKLEKRLWGICKAVGVRPEDLHTRHKGADGYTVIDVDAGGTKAQMLAEEFCKLAEVRRVRILP